VIGGMVVGIFATYPSATSVLMLGSTALTLFLTSPRATSLRAFVVGTSIVMIGVVAVVNLDAGVEITDEYFDRVQKANANNGRLDLWSQGLAKFAESPVWGAAWSGEVVAVRERDKKALPYHNDFILFLAEGGLVALGLLVAWIVWLETTLLRRYRGYLRFGRHREAMLTRVILVTLNGFFTAMGFNPVLPGLTRSIAVFGLAGIALSLAPPRPVVREDAFELSAASA
jgi:O-antigen ligase